MSQVSVVQEQNPQRKDEVIQKCIVRGQNYADLPRSDNEKADQAPASREEKHPDQHQFESQRRESGRNMKPVRQVLYVPSDPGWQGTVLVILDHGRKMTPFRVAAQYLGDPRFEVNAEPLPLQQEQTCSRGRRRTSPPWEKPSRRKEQRNEPRLQQHTVGLIARKILSRTYERQITDEADKQCPTRPYVEHHQNRSPHTRPAQQHQHVRTAGEPQQRRRKPSASDISQRSGYDLQIFIRRQNSLWTDEPADLKHQGEKCTEVNEPQSAQEYPTRKQTVLRSPMRIEKPPNYVDRAFHRPTSGGVLDFR